MGCRASVSGASPGRRSPKRCGSLSVVKLLAPLLVGASLVATVPVAAKPKEQTVTKPVEVDTFCDVYGEGFQRVPGSDVCVKISGSVTATVGFSSGSKSGKPSH